MVMMEMYLLILLKIFQWSDCTIRVFQLFDAWITYSRALQKYKVAIYNHFHIILYKIQMLLFIDHSEG